MPFKLLPNAFANQPFAKHAGDWITPHTRMMISICPSVY